MSDRALLERAVSVIESSDELALACHIGPDGDALGSMLALGLAAASAGKKVVASFGSPFLVPGNLAFLPGDLLVPPKDFPDRPRTMVVFDAGSQDRLGELGANAADSQVLVVFDHHVTNEGFGDVAVIDPVAAATGELVYEALEVLGWPLTPEIATCLHTALVSDTGRFQYANTRPRTLELGARLIEAGADPAEISRHLYEEVPFGYLKAAAAALARAELDADLSLVTAVVTQDDLKTAGVDWGDMDNLINTVRLAEEADATVLAKVHADKRIKVSMRSRGGTDVGSLAAEFDGGGHRLAAGFTFEGTPDQLFAEIRQRIGKYR